MRNCMMPQGHPTHCGCEPFERPSLLKTTNVRYATSTQPAEAEGVERWSELRELAEKAVIKDQPASTPITEMIGALDGFRGACQPGVILELLAALSAVTAERDRLTQDLKNVFDNDLKMATLREQEGEIKQLRAEVEALRKDAERYRWSSPICAVKDPKSQAKPGTDCPTRDRLDAAIDAAMAAKEGSGEP